MFGGNKFAYKIPQMRRPALPFSQPRSTVQSLLNRQLQRVKRHRLDGLPACLHTPKLDAALQITAAAKARPASMLQNARQTAAGRHQPAAHNPDHDLCSAARHSKNVMTQNSKG